MGSLVFGSQWEVSWSRVFFTGWPWWAQVDIRKCVNSLSLLNHETILSTWRGTSSLFCHSKGALSTLTMGLTCPFERGAPEKAWS